MVLSLIPSGAEAFAKANIAAAELISGAGSADSATMLAAAVEAVGPIGAGYLAAYGPAQANNLSSTLRVGDVHAAIGAATDSSRAAFIAADNA